jgi:hypothetical protein
VFGLFLATKKGQNKVTKIRRKKQLLEFFWAEIRESIAFSHFGSAGSQKSSEIAGEKTKKKRN